jgi:hypothetical protein
MKASFTTLVAVLTIGSVGLVAANALACDVGGYGGYGRSVGYVRNSYAAAPSFAPTFAPGHCMIVVLPGDSWFSICSREYGNSGVWSRVAEFNGMPQNLPLTVGMQLRLPVINPNGSLSLSAAPAMMASAPVQGFNGGFRQGLPQGFPQGMQQGNLPQGFAQGGMPQGAQFGQPGGMPQGIQQGGLPQANGFAPQGQGFAPQQGQMGLPQGGQLGQPGGIPQGAQFGQQGQQLGPQGPMNGPQGQGFAPQGGQPGPQAQQLDPQGQPIGQQGEQVAPQAPIAPQAPGDASENIGMVPQLDDANQANGQAGLPSVQPGLPNGQPAVQNAAPNGRPLPSIVIGSLMSIGGQQLGNERGMVHLTVNGTTQMLEIVEWNANGAKVKVPANLPAGVQAQLEIIRADGSIVTKDQVQLAAGQKLAAGN